MTSSLQSRRLKDSYEELLKLDTIGSGLSGSLTAVVDGTGVASPLKLSTLQIALNNLVWPTVNGSQGQFLSIGAGNQLQWSTASNIQSTSDVPEGTNLYYTDARASAAAPVQSVNGKTGTAVLKSDDVAEGTTNLYFTSARAASAAPVQQVNGKTGTVTLSTTDISEGTNQYFTTARASAAAPVQSVNGKTGTVALTAADVSALALTGGTLTGALTLAADPSANLHAATKQYVDAKISAPGSAAGSAYQIQFNNGGTLAGASGFTFNGTQVGISSANSLSVGGPATFTGTVSVSASITSPAAPDTSGGTGTAISLNAGNGSSSTYRLTGGAVNINAGGGSGTVGGNGGSVNINGGNATSSNGGTAGNVNINAGVSNSSSTNNGQIYLSTGGSTRLTIDNNGNATVTNNFTVNGVTTFTGASTFGSTVTLKADPTLALQASTKQYVDNQVATKGTGDFKADGSVAMTGTMSAKGINSTDTIAVSSTFSAPTYATWAGGNNAVVLNGQAKVRATASKSAGKSYWEVTVTAGSVNTAMIGIDNSTNGTTFFGYNTTNSGYALYNNGWYANGSSSGSAGFTLAIGDIIGMALDLDNHTLAFYRNGTLVKTFTGITAATYYPAVATYNGTGTTTSFTGNFGATAYAEPQPLGYVPPYVSGGGTGGLWGIVQTAAQPAITSVGTLQGLMLSADPTSALGAATKQYVDNAVTSSTSVIDGGTF